MTHGFIGERKHLVTGGDLNYNVYPDTRDYEDSVSRFSVEEPASLGSSLTADSRDIISNEISVETIRQRRSCPPVNLFTLGTKAAVKSNVIQEIKG